MEAPIGNYNPPDYDFGMPPIPVILVFIGFWALVFIGVCAWQAYKRRAEKK